MSFNNNDDQTAGLQVPYHWRDYSAWRLISELTRRHPGRFRVMEGAYAEGIPTSVWYLTEDDGSRFGRQKILINNTGSVTIADHSDSCTKPHSERVDDRVRTLDVMFAESLEEVVRHVEGCLGLESPAKAPQTGSKSIGSRVIAEALGLYLHTKTHLRIEGFFFDANRFRHHLGLPFPHLKNELLQSATFGADDDVWDELFFLHDSRDRESHQGEPMHPILGVDLKRGVAYTKQHRHLLTDFYAASNRNISVTAFQLINQARLDAKG